MNKNNLLDTTFFNRPTLDAAEKTLGIILCRQYEDGSISRHRITEIEAYAGPIWAKNLNDIY